MQEDCSTFQIPTLGKQKAYNFEPTNTGDEIYQELCQIAEEIEKCRQRNL